MLAARRQLTPAVPAKRELVWPIPPFVASIESATIHLRMLRAQGFSVPGEQAFLNESWCASNG